MMNNNLIIFNNNELGEIRITSIKGEPWFVASDVCTILNLSNPTVSLKQLDEDEKAKLNLGLRGGETNIINESGLYSLMMSSRKPEAKKFKKWVTAEVLPSIRKHGAYMTENTLEQIMSNPDFMIGLLTNLKAEQEARREAEEEKEALMLENQQVKQIAEDNLEKAQAYEIMFKNTGGFSVEAVAKAYGVKGLGRNNMFKYLREIGWVCAKSPSPKQSAIDLGYVKSYNYSYFNAIGEQQTIKTLLTEKGIRVLYKKLSETDKGKNLKTVDRILSELQNNQGKA